MFHQTFFSTARDQILWTRPNHQVIVFRFLDYYGYLYRFIYIFINFTGFKINNYVNFQ